MYVTRDVPDHLKKKYVHEIVIASTTKIGKVTNSEPNVTEIELATKPF